MLDQGTAALNAPLTLGPFRVAEPVLLAPMAGITDRPFRRMVQAYGAGLVFSEMIACQAMVRQNDKTLRRTAGEGLTSVQLVGCEPAAMAEAARMNEANGAQLLDINFGCPAKKIVNNLAGSALMRDEPLARRIIEAVVRAVRVPVSVKMRLGWDREHLNAPAFAKMAEASGACWVSVHGRTRNQFYAGASDWAAVRAVKDAVAIPVIVNGDITDVASMREALRLSGADGVMVGRGALGRPWLLAQLMAALAGRVMPPDPTLAERYRVLSAHWEAMQDEYGVDAGLRIARKHLGWYSKSLPNASAFRARVNACADPDGVRALLRGFFEPLLEQEGKGA
jgi:tRNA-dihydrouridine synthase B